MTHRNWFVAQEVEVLIIPKQVLPWLWGLKPLPTHDEVSTKIAPCLNTKHSVNCLHLDQRQRHLPTALSNKQNKNK